MFLLMKHKLINFDWIWKYVEIFQRNGKNRNRTAIKENVVNDDGDTAAYGDERKR